MNRGLFGRAGARSRGAAGTAGSGGGMVQLAQIIVSSPAPTITIPNIPSGFTNLLLTVVGKGTASSGAGGTGINLQLSGDAGANYDWVRNDNTPGGFDGAEGYSGTSMSMGYFNNASGSAAPSALSITIYDYARTVWQKAMSAAGMFCYQSSSPGMRMITAAGVWKSTAPVTSLLLGTSDGNFAAGTVATLYGVS